MKTSTSKMIAMLTIGVAAWAASSASACGGGFKVSFGGGRGHVSIGHRNHHHHGHHHHPKHHHVHVKKVYVKPVYVKPAYVAPCIHPLHSFCFVYPGDTWLSLSQREYGRPNFAATIAAFNGLSNRLPLVVGQQLRLPVIHPNGSLTRSAAPAPAPFALPSQPNLDQALSFNPSQLGEGQPMSPQGMPMNLGGFAPTNPASAPMNSPAGTPNAQPNAAIIPAANIREASEERSLPRVAIGSVLSLDGQSLGSDKGVVRLRIGGMALPIEVLEWNAEAAKIRLPEIDLASPMKAEIEVVRADGSLASKSAVELTSAATRLALGN